MSRIDDIYKSAQKAKADQEKENISAFITGLESGLAKDLNNAYANDPNKYQDVLNNVKQTGARVLRNSQGQHKVIYDKMPDLFNGIV